jgi:molecular chaperone Hsp33
MHALASPDELVRTLSADGQLSVRAVVATRLVADAAARHGTAPTATAALGRALMGAILLASDAQDDETIQLQFRGDGVLGTVTAIGRTDGGVRGYVGNPAADLPPRAGKLDVGGAVGRGILSVVRHHPSWREPYLGVVPLRTGEIAEDLAGYLLESEQRPAAVALGVFLEADGSVGAAGGFMVHVLPGASEEAVAQLEANVLALPAPSEMLRAGLCADDVVDRLLGSLGSGRRVRLEPAFHCGCGRERILRAITLLGRDELREIASADEPLEVRCEFCGARYSLLPDEVASLVRD